MNRRVVRYAPAAERDLERLSDWLADVASESIAIRYISRVRARIDSLAYGGERGTIRPQLSGLRVIGIMKSLSIAFVVSDDKIDVQRIIYRGQNWQAAFGHDE